MGVSKSKIDLIQLSKEIKAMTVRKQLYIVLKNELSEIGYWKNKKRGKPNPKFSRG